MQLKLTNNYLVGAGVCVLLCSGTQLFAQQSNRLAGTNVLVENQANLPGFIEFQNGHEIRQSDFANWAGTALNLPVSATFQSYSVETDELGFTHTRYKQYVNGVPVQGTMVITHAKNGIIESVNGDYYNNFQASYSKKPVISEETALKAALKYVNASSYMWENKEVEENLRTALSRPDFTYTPKAELVVYHKENTAFTAANMVLTYRFDIFAEEPLSRTNVFVDVVSGEIVGTESLLHAADETGTANTLYSGTRTISSSKSGSDYILSETGRGKGIDTKSWPQKSNITNSSANWNITTKDRYGLDAHWGAEMSYDYYKNRHNRNSLDGNGIKLLSYIHNSDNMNAYWTGSYMLYGDGNGNDVKAFAALDVCGHELTHGVITHSANLTYSNESGALNEGFADIFGTCVEAFARPGANEHNWVMGTDFTTNLNWQRSLKDPNAHKKPDTYKGTNWATGSGDNGGVHTNSGPIGHWFYLLSEGGKGTNDKGDAFEVNGITIEKAEKIAYRALTSYMTNSTNYAGARTAGIKAATDLYGACSPEVIATTNAFYAIGVGAKDSNTLPNSVFSADKTEACGTPVAIKFTNSSTNATTYKWDFGDGSNSTDKEPSHDYTKAGTYTVKLTTEGGSCPGAKDEEIKTAYIVVHGSPVGVDSFRCGPGIITLEAKGDGTIKWYDSPATTTVLGTGATFTTPHLTATTTYYITSTFPACTTPAVPVEAEVRVCTGIDENGGFGIDVFPNPAHNLLNIKATESIQAVYIIDMLGKVVMQDNAAKKNNLQLNVSELPAGFYFVKVTTADAQKLIKIIKE